MSKVIERVYLSSGVYSSISDSGHVSVRVGTDARHIDTTRLKERLKVTEQPISVWSMNLKQ